MKASKTETHNLIWIHKTSELMQILLSVGKREKLKERRCLQDLSKMMKCVVCVVTLFGKMRISVTVYMVVVDRFIPIVSKDASNTTSRMESLYSAHYVGQTGDQMDLIN